LPLSASLFPLFYIVRVFVVRCSGATEQVPVGGALCQGLLIAMCQEAFSRLFRLPTPPRLSLGLGADTPDARGVRTIRRPEWGRVLAVEPHLMILQVGVRVVAIVGHPRSELLRAEGADVGQGHLRYEPLRPKRRSLEG